MKNLFLYAALALSLSSNLAAHPADFDPYNISFQDLVIRVDNLDKQFWKYKRITDELEDRIKDLESRTKNL